MLTGFNEIEEELERQLDAKAAKTNLTAKNVKNMLRHVITDTHVVEMIKNQLHNTGEGVVFEPRLTRAKAKELAKTQPIISWPLLTVPPVLPTPSSEVRALIEEDLPEDSSDEEYNPDLDLNRACEAEVTSTTSDDFLRPATPTIASEAGPENGEALERVQLQSDCEFEILDFSLTEQETIGQRTRSKLDLGGLTVEEIEGDFLDPDVTPDLYDFGNINDPANRDWMQFLSGLCGQEHSVDPAVEDDPDDHEYNVSEDMEGAMEDSEEHRKDKAVQVTKKELNALIAELTESAEAYTQTQKKKKAAEDSSGFSPEIFTQNAPVPAQSTCPPQEVFIPHQNVYDNVNVTPEFVDNPQLDSTFYQQLWIQFQQHVQLTAQHFVLTYMHPALHDQSETCRKHLNEIRQLLKTNSSILVGNLDAAMGIVSEWEEKLRDENFANEYMKTIENQIATGAHCRERSLGHNPKFHPEMIRIFLNSDALMYPRLLPDNPPRVELINPKNNKSPYTPSEEKLLALGLSEFYPMNQSKVVQFKRSKRMVMMDTLRMISQYLMPCRAPGALYSHVKTMSNVTARCNPVQDYILYGILPAPTSLSALDFDMKAPKDQEPSLLSEVWQKYLGAYLRRHKSAKNLMIALSKSTEHICVGRSLCSPIVNMLPSTKKRKLNSDDNNADSSCKPTSPQLRKTTPRLAKIRSAQNMKLMTQVSSTKAGSSAVSVKARGKKQPRKSETSTTKVDNEEEIAELMLASTTIKKDTANRKKAKQARESENIKRMLQAENESGQEERATKLASSFMQKLHVTLESSNPEKLRVVINLWLNYDRKLENLKRSNTNKETEDPAENKDDLAIKLYRDVKEALQGYPELIADLALFLSPHQAAMMKKSENHMMMQKMSDFINDAQVYFAKQPSRMTKVMQAITQLAPEQTITVERVHTFMDPLLKGHQLMSDSFQQLLPGDKPPDILFLGHLFENLTCPVLPHDKQRVYTEDSAELYENIELPGPSTQEDPYGGDNCKCNCHEAVESSSKTPTEHCISCGMRFLNGRVFLQTSGGLRPAKVTFSADSEEQLENIARVSLKTTEKPVPTPAPTSRRRKSSKNDDDQAQKYCPVKSSPTKETSDEGEKATKTKRGARSPPKAVDQRRQSKSTEPGGSGVIIAATESPAHLKSKREKRAERREAKAESKNLNDAGKVCGYASPVFSDPEEATERAHGSEDIKRLQESSDSEQNLSADAAETASLSDSKTSAEPVDSEKPWSREHDALLLQNVQKNYSEETFVLVSEMLGRSIDEVKTRFKTLLTVLEKLA